MDKHYIFTSARLGFRDWLADDVSAMAAINAHERVMEYFPAVQTEAQTIAFIERMQKQYAEKGYCYFAVDRLDTGAFIGFIGLSLQIFKAAFTPCVDVGWRLAYGHWGEGFATEGAKRCLEYAFGVLALSKVVAVCPVVNARSEAVMRKTGMHKTGSFVHPLLLEDERLRDCVVYELGKEDFYKS